jgi:Transposase DDE domain
MIEKFIAIYVFIDDILIEIGHKEPVNRNASDSEVITVALIAAKYFHGNIDHAISFAKSTNLSPGMLSKSRFNRRIHSIFELLIDLFSNTAELIKKLNISSEYSIDSFPVATCENIRICRSRLIKGVQYRGYKPSMRKYFYGFSVQVIATVDGIPVEFAMLPGCYHDIDGMKNMFFNLPENSTVYGDSAYTDYNCEDIWNEADGIKLMIARKSNTKRPHEPWENFLIANSRKRVETTFSQISSMFPKRIHAVTVDGFLMKVILFIFVFTINEKFL